MRPPYATESVEDIEILPDLISLKQPKSLSADARFLEEMNIFYPARLALIECSISWSIKTRNSTIN